MYTVLDLLPVHGIHTSTITLLYIYTVLGLPLVHGADASTIGFVLLYYLLGDIKCLSECFACPCYKAVV